MKREYKPIARRILQLLLSASKDQSQIQIYNRIAPGPDGRIRTVCSPVGTETGRFSHSETFIEASTNLGNLTKKYVMVDPIYNVRQCLVPREGYAFVECDLSQAEARATSAYANDYDTLAVFDSGRDIHKWTASRIFDKPMESITKTERHLGKMVRHALNYGMGWQLFMEQINKDVDITGIGLSAAKAKEIVEAYHNQSPALLEWWEDTYRKVLNDGYLVNCWGRRRDFISPKPRPTDVYAYLPQSTIADLLNEGLVRFFQRYDNDDTHALVLQIHDAILVECPQEQIEQVAKDIVECLTIPMQIGDITLVVPVDASYSYDSWGDMKDV